ncbi:MAG: hypothetical protein KA508_00490 [Gammaproteobacteria bacterium]|nr:hypothetical protein [Gammaproteobacteria bacterium]
MPLPDMPSLNELHIKKFASKVTHNSEPNLVPVFYHPEKWASHGMCFENVSLKVQSSGGEVIFGWTFHYCNVGHLEAVHHAVWKAPDHRLVDITPFGDSMRPMLMYQENYIRFLVNNDSKPMEPKPGLPLALLSKFYPLNDDKGSLELIRQLELKEEQECEKNIRIFCQGMLYSNR